MNATSIVSVCSGVLLGCALKGTVVIGVAYGAARLLRRRSAALRHQILVLGILGSLALPVLLLVAPRWELNYAAAAPERAGQIASEVEDRWAEVPAMIVQASESVTGSGDAANWIVGLWLVGFSLALARMVRGAMVARRWWRRSLTEVPAEWNESAERIGRAVGKKGRVEIRASQFPDVMPATKGAWRPEILLPATAKCWPERRLEIVLAHELAHVRRKDWLAQIASQLASCVYWFHPVFWIAVRELREESEQACDDEVLELGVGPREYASELVLLAGTLNGVFGRGVADVGMARTSQLEGRIKNMFDKTRERKRAGRRVGFSVLLLGLLLVVPLAALKLPAQAGAGSLSGGVEGATKEALANATVTLWNGPVSEKILTVTDAAGKFTFKGLPAGEYEMTVERTGYAAARVPHVKIQGSNASEQNVSLTAGEKGQDAAWEDHSAGPVGEKAKRIAIGGNVQAAKIVNKVQPTYPSDAKDAGIQGEVKLHAVIARDGTILALRVLNPEVDPRLAASAVNAVHQWKYKTTLLNGEPVQVDTTIVIVYSLQE